MPSATGTEVGEARLTREGVRALAQPASQPLRPLELGAGARTEEVHDLADVLRDVAGLTGRAVLDRRALEGHRVQRPLERTDPGLQGAHELLPRQEQQHRQRGDQRLLRGRDLPPRLAQHHLELLLALPREDVARPLRALVAPAALMHGDAAVFDQRADRAVDRARLDVRRLLEAPADQLPADDVAVHGLHRPDRAEDQEAGGGHAPILVNLDFRTVSRRPRGAHPLVSAQAATGRDASAPIRRTPIHHIRPSPISAPGIASTPVIRSVSLSHGIDPRLTISPKITYPY